MTDYSRYSKTPNLFGAVSIEKSLIFLVGCDNIALTHGETVRL